MGKRLFGLAMFGILCAGSAIALPVIKDVKPIVINTAVSSGVAQNNNIDAVLLSPSNGMSQGQALSDFVFNFENGDHKINSIGLMTNADAIESVFADMDGNDPYSVKANYVVSNSFINGEVVGGFSRNSETNFNIPAPPVGYTTVLRGFHILRANGVDANIKRVKIWVNNDTSIGVYFSHDMGVDFRKLEVGKGHFSWSGVRGDQSSLIGKDNESLRNAANANPNERPYGFMVRVQYTYVPFSMLGNVAVLSGNGRTIANGTLPAAGKKVLLKGFEFNFLNSDHHLLQIGLRIPSNRTEQAIFFQDNNQDDPINWRASYVTLK